MCAIRMKRWKARRTFAQGSERSRQIVKSFSEEKWSFSWSTIKAHGNAARFEFFSVTFQNPHTLCSLRRARFVLIAPMYGRACNRAKKIAWIAACKLILIAFRWNWNSFCCPPRRVCSMMEEVGGVALEEKFATHTHTFTDTNIHTSAVVQIYKAMQKDSHKESR